MSDKTSSLNETESLLTFPCEFPIKAMGRADQDMVKRIIELLEPHCGPVSSTQIKTRLSSGDKYISVTVDLTITSRAQLDAIYQDLSDDETVLMAL